MINEVITWLNTNLTNGIVGALTIFAIFFAPITALWLQKKIENYNEEKYRKLGIFKTLLATRAELASLEHVKALNMIDIEFYKEKQIKNSWNIYRDHLSSSPNSTDKSSEELWEERRREYLTDLLYCMSKFFGYDFDKVILKKGAYSPLAHGLLNLEQSIIRKGLAAIVTGEKPMKVEILASGDESVHSDKEFKP